MPKKEKKSENRSTWSEEMLKEFLDSIGPNSFSTTLFLVQEKQTRISFKSNKQKHDIDLGYVGILAREGLDDVYFSLRSSKEDLNDLYFSDMSYEEGEQDYQNCVGYLELLNGISDDHSRKVPMIRGFVKHDVGLFETVDSMMRDTRIFNQKMPLFLEVHLPHFPTSMIYYRTGEIKADDIFYKKIFIEYIEVSQRLSFNEMK